MSVAARLYLEDARLLTFHAAVTDIRELARQNGAQVWQIALDRTAFYPAGGGQPCDRGALTAKARSGAALIVPVDDVVEDEAGEVWHRAAKPLLAGTQVLGGVDADRRLDHMQQHSGQHLLSAVLWNDLQARTVSFHLGEKDVTVDLDCGSGGPHAVLHRLDLDSLAQVQTQVNRLLRSNLPVTARYVSREEAEALLAEGALRKLPDRPGAIRLVEIPGVDLSACGGTHLTALGEIGVVLLRQTERVRQGLRLHFLCGERAELAARADWTELSAVAAQLSVGVSSARSGVERLQAEARALAKERQRLREQLAEDLAVQLAVEEHIVDGVRLVCRTWPDRDAEYIRLVAMRLLQAVPRTAAILVSTAGEPATLVVASNFACGNGQPGGCEALLREVLAPYKLRGGGTPELAQAQVPANFREPVVDALRRRLTESS